MGDRDAHNHSTNNLKSDITYSSRCQVLRCVFVWKGSCWNWIFPFSSLVGVLRDAVLGWVVSGIRGHFQQQAAVGDKASCLISRNSPSLLFAPSYSLHRTVTLNQVLQFFFNFYTFFQLFSFFQLHAWFQRASFSLPLLFCITLPLSIRFFQNGKHCFGDNRRMHTRLSQPNMFF